MKSLALAVAALLATLILAGCASSPEAQPGASVPTPAPHASAFSATDDFGHTLSLTAPPQRIVSLAPNITEILFAIGLGERVVGVSEYCDFPPAAREKSSIGRYDKPNIEKILALNPDLVILGFGNPGDLVESLQQFDLPAFGLNPRSTDEIFDAILRLGKVCGAQPEAEALVAGLKARLAKIKETLSANMSKRPQPPKVFIVVDTESLWTVGTDTLQDELLQLAGGENIAAFRGSYFPISKETLLQAQPDLILVPGDTSQAAGIRAGLMSRQDLQGLGAIRRGDIEIIDGDTYSRPGPRAIDAVEQLHEILSRYSAGK